MMETLPLGFETMSSALVTASNYHRWNYDWIAPHLSGKILDIGGGTGNHISFLKDFDLVSVDISPECVSYLKAKYASNGNWSFVEGDITSDSVVSTLGTGNFDTVLSCNVFEHIPDDQKAAFISFKVLKPGGKIVLLLPAHESLFGNMDTMAGHFRRYSKKTASALLTYAGFQVEELRYVNVLGALGWFVNNRVVKHNHLSSKGINGQIRLFDRFGIPVMRFLEGKRGMPFGQSLVAVGRKI